MLNALRQFRRPKRRAEDGCDNIHGQIGSGLTVEGELRSDGNYLVYGIVAGKGEIDGAVIIAEGGRWRGDLTARYVRILGAVEGNVFAAEKIELGPRSYVSGDLASPVIAIAEGAAYSGAITRPRRTQITHYRERRGNEVEGGSLPA